MRYLTSIVVKLQFEGIHSWPSCDLADVAFLAAKHRHLFHITATKRVEKDRGIEIIMLKREIQSYLAEQYPDRELGSMSCEALATELLDRFGLDQCAVLEDGENGAVVSDGIVR